MDERSLLEILSGERHGFAATALRGVLTGLSVGYRAAMAFRNGAYDRGWLITHHVSVPVISVGNITTGGTGKTPLVAWVAQQLSAREQRPGILSRGYRRLDDQANDEARVLERLCPGVPHVQQRDRVAGAQLAVAEHHCRSLVLDDGFQHRRLARDLDIVLIDALNPWGYGHLLPRGLLREPVAALQRADLVIITRADLASADVLASIRWTLRRVRGRDDHAAIAFVPQRLMNAHGEFRPLTAFNGASAVAFCGIGNPAGFAATLSRGGWTAPQRTFADHHHYTVADWEALAEWQRETEADVVLTTLKDLVKLPATHPLAGQTWALDLGVEFLRGEYLIQDALGGIFDESRQRRAA